MAPAITANSFTLPPTPPYSVYVQWPTPYKLAYSGAYSLIALHVRLVYIWGEAGRYIPASVILGLLDIRYFVS